MHLVFTCRAANRVGLHPMPFVERFSYLLRRVPANVIQTYVACRGLFSEEPSNAPNARNVDFCASVTPLIPAILSRS